MRPFSFLVLYLLAVFLGGALIAPWLHGLVQTLFPNSALAHNPFHRYLDRAILGTALVGIWPLVCAFDIKSWRKVGLIKPAGQWRRWFAGFLLGFASLGLVVTVVILAGARTPVSDTNTNKVLVGLGSAVASALVVSVLEELLFRGALFGTFRRVWDWRFALLFSSMIYAIVHFIGKADLSGPVTWSSGFRLLPMMLHPLVEPGVLIPGFLSLTLAGILLGFAYQQTGNLYFSIGLHASWIFWAKCYGLLTQPVDGISEHFWGSSRLFDGWLVFFVLGSLCLLMSRPLFFSPTDSRS
jgi:membrane protease YdiL (CAAX protease family)